MMERRWAPRARTWSISPPPLILLSHRRVSHRQRWSMAHALACSTSSREEVYQSSTTVKPQSRRPYHAKFPAISRRDAAKKIVAGCAVDAARVLPQISAVVDGHGKTENRSRVQRTARVGHGLQARQPGERSNRSHVRAAGSLADARLSANQVRATGHGMRVRN